MGPVTPSRGRRWLRRCASRGPIAVALLLTVLGVGSSAGAEASSRVSLVGAFTLQAGGCASPKHSMTGSYFRLIVPNGTVRTGPYFDNPSSPCADKSYTPLRPGTAGGLVTGTFQPGSVPPFSKNGDATANSIVLPVAFSGVALSLVTARLDPEFNIRVPAPSIVDTNGRLSGQVEALSLSWNKIYVNQGSPKPDGTFPGLTNALRGRYSATTGQFALTWTSAVVGGPLIGLSGQWHFAGRFVPQARVAVAPPGTRTSTLRSAVKLLTCAAAPGGWSAGGTARNSTDQAAIYSFDAAFLTARGRLLATSGTSVRLAPGRGVLWSTTAEFRAPAAVRCQLGTVAVRAVP